MSNRRQVASSEPVANACPFGKNVIALMSLSCPESRNVEKNIYHPDISNIFILKEN
jgi:hypothetical protein